MRQVIILRGIPGAGKSTLITQEFPGALVVSADHYFMKEGQYAFDRTKLPQAHQACWLRFYDAVSDGQAETVVIDNTNISLAEIAPYVLPAEANGYAVRVITLLCPPTVAANRNIHAVPAIQIGAMDARLRDATAQIPPWWNHEIRKVE